MSELLLELFSEEIPAVMQKDAETGFKEIFIKYFTRHEISFNNLAVYVGPRRVTIHAEGLPAKIAAKEIEIKGPKTEAPGQALEGFCRANSIMREELIIKEISGAKYYFIQRTIPEKNTQELLLDTLAEPIGEYVWPKSMYWSDYKIKWVRPLKNILCIFEGKAIPFKYGHLTANNCTYGHRFMAPAELKVQNFNEYHQGLEKQFVVLDRRLRAEKIKKSLEQAAGNLNLVLKDDPALLEEVAGLVEYPVVLTGKINQKFLGVPSEILIASMRSNQKYFSLFDRQDEFAPYFLFVSNIVSDEPTLVIEGNEKVLSARLSDALYFWQRDLADGALDKRQEKLKSVIFHAKLGTLHQKCERVKNIISYFNFESFCKPILLQGGVMQVQDEVLPKLQNAAIICKNDITSELVGEFPELQGIIGYRLDEKIKANGSVEFSEAIRDHYKPLGPSDEVPVGPAAILAIADKIDSIVGLFLAGEHPTGSGDPYALRRQALGIIRIILELDESSKKNGNPRVHLNLKDLVEFCANQYKNQINRQSIISGTGSVMSFLEDRVRYYLKDKYDIRVINAVLDFSKESDLVIIKTDLIALDELVKSESGQKLISLYKRAKNILAGQSPQGKVMDYPGKDYDNNLFKYSGDVKEKISKPLSEGNLEQALNILLDFTIPITQFFDNVLVMDDSNPDLKNNRLCLLKEITELFEKVAGFDLL